MGARSSGGARGSGRGAAWTGSPLQKLAKKVEDAFYSEGVNNYFDGDNSAAAMSAYAKYDNLMSTFQQAYVKTTGEIPSGGWDDIISDLASGEIDIK